MNTIDAVISWVDGYDPIFQKKLSTFCRAQGIEPNIAVEPTRIQQKNEIYYCLHALRRFAPWIRTIYIITNQQVPPVVRALQGTPFGNKIQMIDQNELLQACNVHSPVFNSITVEWLIWRIKGLSNQFIYLNDDFFVIRDVSPDVFFRNHQMVFRGVWKVQSKQKLLYQLKKYFFSWMTHREIKPKTNPHRAWQEKSARIAGWDHHFYLLPHAPFPLIKETFEQLINEKPELLIDNLQFAFRDPKQVSSIPLMVHLDIKHHRVLYDANYQAIMVNGASHSFKKIKNRLQRADSDRRVAFLCMQSIDEAPFEIQQYMIDWLDAHIIE
jgi:hypothetical protein